MHNIYYVNFKDDERRVDQLKNTESINAAFGAQ